MKTVVFARCRSCENRVRLILETSDDGYLPMSFGAREEWMPADKAVGYFVWCAKTDTVRPRRGGVYADGSTTQQVPHGPMVGRRVKARYSDVPCDDRCTHATGASCKCSCGGVNHGCEAM